MLEFNASAFYHLSSALIAANGVVSAYGSKDQKTHVTIDNMAILHHVLKEQTTHLSVLNAKVTLLAANEIMTWLAGKQQITYEHLSREFDELNHTLRRELSAIRLYVLEDNRQHYYVQE